MRGAKPARVVSGRESTVASGRTSMALTVGRREDDGGGGTGWAEESR